MAVYTQASQIGLQLIFCTDKPQQNDLPFTEHAEEETMFRQ
jgi:hypothetical protein